MEQDTSLPGPKSGRLVIGTGIAVVALFLLRGIVDSLPTFKNSPAISGSLLADSLLSPLVICNAAIDTGIVIIILTFGLRLGRNIQIHGQRYSGLSKIVTRATLAIVLIFASKTYELPAACIFVTRTNLVNLHKSIAQSKGAYPDFIGIWAPMVDQLDVDTIQNASGDALTAYQQIALAMFRRSPDYYGWASLVLIAILVIGLLSVVLRNLNTMADLLLRGTSTSQRIPSSAPRNQSCFYAPGREKLAWSTKSPEAADTPNAGAHIAPFKAQKARLRQEHCTGGPLHLWMTKKLRASSSAN